MEIDATVTAAAKATMPVATAANNATPITIIKKKVCGWSEKMIENDILFL